MQNKFDIVILGSGLGGLASAVILAKNGLKVCVLEKNNQFGGNLQTFSRDKLIFDTGVHYLGGLDSGQNLHHFFSYLGIMNGLKLSRMSENGYDFISFDNDEKLYPHAQGYQNFTDQLSRLFPAEKSNIRTYITEIQRVCAHFPRYELQPGNVVDEEIFYENTWDFICSITQNTKLRAVLCGSNFLYAGNRNTPLYVHALTVNSYIQSAYKCNDGGSQIAKLLVREIRKLGGCVHRRCKITEVTYGENREIISVHTENGKSFSAEKFISNMDIKTTVDIFGMMNFSKPLVNRVKNLKPTVSCFSVYIVLKPEHIKYFNCNRYHFRSAEQIFASDNSKPEKWPSHYMVSATAQRSSRDFAESMTILSYMDFDEVSRWENTSNTVAQKAERNEEYEKFKALHAEKLIDEVCRKMPELKDAISAVYTSSPLTYRDYIGTDSGAMYGYQKDSEHPMQTFFSPRTKIPNLFLTGQSVNMHGILGVTIGAFTTCTEILGMDPLAAPENNTFTD